MTDAEVPDLMTRLAEHLKAVTANRPKTIVGYLYRDEYYCPGCIVEQVIADATPFQRDNPESALSTLARIIGLDRLCSFSQRDFPHTITSGQLDEPAPLCETCRTEIR